MLIYTAFFYKNISLKKIKKKQLKYAIIFYLYILMF
jgi:hypothetical protein